eukprot:363552-Chlamydomonas_euryale.AAC.12
MAAADWPADWPTVWFAAWAAVVVSEGGHRVADTGSRYEIMKAHPDYYRCQALNSIATMLTLCVPCSLSEFCWLLFLRLNHLVDKTD